MWFLYCHVNDYSDYQVGEINSSDVHLDSGAFDHPSTTANHHDFGGSVASS